MKNAEHIGTRLWNNKIVTENWSEYHEFKPRQNDNFHNVGSGEARRKCDLTVQPCACNYIWQAQFVRMGPFSNDQRGNSCKIVGESSASIKSLNYLYH